MRVALLLLLSATACATDVAEGYLTSAEFRRAELEASLWRPDLPYSRSLLAAYSRGSYGWDLLPELAAESAPFTVADGVRLASGEALEVGAVSGPPAEALGEWAFHRAPMRNDSYVTWLASRPDLWAELGLEQNADGEVRGLVKYVAPGGAVTVGVTCALCHAAGGRPGSPSRILDLGRARALHAEAVGRAVDPAWNQWGPGRADVTDEGSLTITRIPALWGVSHARYLNASGVIEMRSAATLAIRFETQMILGHQMRARPERRVTWALAEYVMALEAPSRPDDHGPGRRIFESRCAGCHDPGRGYAGDLIPADSMLGDRSVAHSRERGTGYYKVPDLLGLAERAPYLHDGSAPTLEALLASGHPRGERLPVAEQSALVEFLVPHR